MNEQFQASLRLDLRKSGFYSKMTAIHACMAAKWGCHGSFTYFDKDERATRECDFEAVRTWDELRADGTKIQVIARLVGQVKKSEKPWIVFMDRQLDHSRFADGLDNIIDTNTTHRQVLSDVLQQRSAFTRKGWVGTGIHEAFKKPNDASRWYSAFVSACKAAESSYEAALAVPRSDTYFEVIKPLVVLDGALIAAELSTDGELLLTETRKRHSRSSTAVTFMSVPAITSMSSRSAACRGILIFWWRE